MQRTLNWCITGILVEMSLWLVGCTDSQNCRTVIATARSESGVVATVCDNTPDALGATVSTATALHLSRQNQALSKTTTMLSADGLQDIKVEWLSGDTLNFSYRGGKIYAFKNFWYPEPVTTQTKFIRIILDDKTRSDKGLR